jgi:uncharacterized Tic20 family protein
LLVLKTCLLQTDYKDLKLQFTQINLFPFCSLVTSPANQKIMYIGLSHFHSLLRWILLILLIASVVKAFMGRSGKSPFTEGDRKRTLFTLISAHIQLVLGIILYKISPVVKSATDNMGAAMKDTVLRYWAVEHISMMIIAIVLITIGHIKSKKAATDIAKFKALAVWHTIALILILISIPWPFRLVGQGRGWF